MLNALIKRNHRFDDLVLTGTFANGSVGIAYSSDLTIAGGNGVYSLTGGDGVTVGSLPAGLSLSIVGSALRLSGTPTAAFSTSFTVGVDSSDGQTATSVQSPAITVSYAKWNPSDRATEVVLSNGNSTAGIIAGSNNYSSVRSDKKITGKVYFEVDLYSTSAHSFTNNFAGIMEISDSLTANPNTIDCFSVAHADGRLTINGTSFSAAGIPDSTTDTRRYKVSINEATRTAWVGLIGGAWQGLGGGPHDPATGSGGMGPINGSVDLYAFACFRKPRPNATATLISNPADMTDTAPTGFTAGF